MMFFTDMVTPVILRVYLKIECWLVVTLLASLLAVKVSEA
jgi:hypothetical protein